MEIAESGVHPALRGGLLGVHGPFCASLGPRRSGRGLPDGALCLRLDELALKAVALLCRGTCLCSGALGLLGALAGELASLLEVTELPRLGGIEATGEFGALQFGTTCELGSLGLEFPLQLADFGVARAAVFLQSLDFPGSAHLSSLERLGALVCRGELLAGEREGLLERRSARLEYLLAFAEGLGLLLEGVGTMDIDISITD